VNFLKSLGLYGFIPIFIIQETPVMRCLKQSKKLLAVVLILWANMLMAQPDYYKRIFVHTKDSLVNVLKKYSSTDTSRAMALVNILESASFLSERKEVIPYWQEAMQLSRKLKFRKTLAAALEWRGSYFKSEQKTDSALLYLDSAIQVAGNSPELMMRRVKGFSLFQKAMIYEGQEKIYTALNSYFESLKNYGPEDLYKQKLISLRIASIYQEFHNDDKALEYYQEALKLYEAINGKIVNSEADGIYTSIAGIYFNRGDLSRASYYLDKLRPTMPDTVETMVTGGYYHLAGQIAMKEQKKDSSILLLREALKYYNYTRRMHIDNIARVCADLAWLNMEKVEMADAKGYVEKSIVAAKESGHKETIVDALTVMAKYYSKSGDPSGAYRTLQRATDLNDSVLKETNIKQANTLAAIYENDKKEKAIAQLETEKRAQSASVKQKTLLNTLFLITIVALVVIGSISYLYFRNRQKIEKQRIAELEKEQQLMGIEVMLRGQEEERARLAKDLHDGLGGMLSGVKIGLATMGESIVLDAANAAKFDKLLQQVDKTIAELRKVAHNLMPDALVKFGLKSAVKDFCESMQLSGNARIICEQFGAERELGNIADVNVYRIIQELVNNSFLHGKGDQTLVQLTKTTDKVLITVEDNGRGFEPGTVGRSSGIGLTNIQSRVNYFHGIMDIESKSGEGTIVNIELIV
jgi:signal transduction histidine kinase